jgi:ABC-2 type transport system permease protein
MDKLLAVIKREFLERVRTRWFLIATLLGPVFFGAITVLPAWMAIRERGSNDAANVRIIDATGAGLGERIARGISAAYNNAPAPQVVTVAPNGVAAAESAATAAVVRREARGYLVLDTATLSGTNARYAGRNASSIADVERLRTVVERQVLASRLERAGVDSTRVQQITSTRFRMPAERITDKGRGGSGTGNAIFAMILAFLLYIMIILYGQTVLRSVLEEKTTRVAEVIVASVKPDTLMAGKVLGVGAVGLLQQVLWFAGGTLVTLYVAPFLAKAARETGGAVSATPQGGPGMMLGLDIGVGTIAAYLAFFLLGYLLYSALFAAVGAMVNSEQEAQQAAFPVMLPLIASAVLIQPILANPESGVAHFAAWFPLTAPIIMPMRMGLVSVSPLEVGAVIAGIALAVVAAIWVAARIYRVGLLMYGKRPNLPELMRWIKQAA